MAHVFTIVSLMLAFAAPLLLVRWWPRRDWRLAVLLIGIAATGWLLLIGAGLVTKYAYDADVFERASLGMPVKQDEYLRDGTGENALALFLGWIVPALGAGAGWIGTAHRAQDDGAR